MRLRVGGEAKLIRYGHNMKNNPKVFGKYVNEKLTKRTGIPDLYMNSNCSTKARSDREKADVLVNYFSGFNRRTSRTGTQTPIETSTSNAAY